MKTNMQRFEIVGSTALIISPPPADGSGSCTFFVRFNPGDGEPPHANEEDEETWHVVEGEFEATIEGRTFTVKKGESVGPIRPGTPHFFRNASGAPASVVIVASPGLQFPSFLGELAACPDLSLAGDLFRRHNITPLWPTPAAV